MFRCSGVLQANASLVNRLLTGKCLFQYHTLVASFSIVQQATYASYFRAEMPAVQRKVTTNFLASDGMADARTYLCDKSASSAGPDHSQSHAPMGNT